MNFNLYVDDKTARELDRAASELGESHRGLIRKALREWLDKKTFGHPGWPSLILEWQGVPDAPPFESYRGELLPPRDDALFVTYLLDTNVLSDFARGQSTVVARLRQESPSALAVSVIAEMEVEYGLTRNPNLATRLREAMRTLLDSIPVLPFEREDARVAAHLRASLNGQGTPIGAYDVLLAACALRRELTIVTHNAREFLRVGGLGLEDWRRP